VLRAQQSCTNPHLHALLLIAAAAAAAAAATDECMHSRRCDEITAAAANAHAPNSAKSAQTRRHFCKDVQHAAQG
jgi:hypothetical protein